MATKLEFLVAKLKVVLALATVSVAISSPDEAMDEMIYEMNDICHFVQLYHPLV